DLLVVVADRRHEDDRHVAPLAQAAGHLVARAVGQQQIEDDRVGRAERRGGERLRRGGGRIDVVPGATEVRRERTPELRRDVDDEYPTAHETTPAGSR